MQQPSDDNPHVFAGGLLDRVGNQRRDPTWITEQRAHSRRRFLVLRNLEVLVEHRSSPAIAWLQPHELPDTNLIPDAILLGLDHEEPRFVIDFTDLERTAVDAFLGHGRHFEEVRDIAANLPLGESATLAQARSLVDWHARHSYCAVCGGTTYARNGGGMRLCNTCSAEHFPRLDPVVIVLVISGERCLLVHGRARPGSNYTCVAGFMEPGETMEEAVRREVFEEAGVRVGPVRYHSSQPWPFPASLMLGCHAEAEIQSVTIDPEEIDDACWFNRGDIARAIAVAAGDVPEDPSLDFGVPAPFTISHQLIRAWALSET
jgi:NAD+ diphosphatase